MNAGDDRHCSSFEPLLKRVRRDFLSKQYGFNCTCDVCSLPESLSKASDERLLEISRRYEKFKTWENGIDGVEAIQHIRKIWEIGEEEGC